MSSRNPRRRHALDTPEGTEAFHSAMMQMVVQGYPAYSIAAELGVSQEVLQRHLDALVDRFREIAMDDMKSWLGQEIEHLYLLRKTAWEQFEASKHPTTRNKIQARRSGKDEDAIMVPMMQEQTTTEVLVGDIRFLNPAFDTTRQLSKMTGMEKFVVTLTAGGNTGNIIEATSDYQDRLERFRAQRADRLSDGHDALSDRGGETGHGRPAEPLDSEDDRPYGKAS